MRADITVSRVANQAVVTVHADKGGHQIRFDPDQLDSFIADLALVASTFKPRDETAG